MRCGPQYPQAPASAFEFDNAEAKAGRFSGEHTFKLPEVKFVEFAAHGYSLAGIGGNHGRVDIADGQKTVARGCPNGGDKDRSCHVPVQRFSSHQRPVDE